MVYASVRKDILDSAVRKVERLRMEKVSDLFGMLTPQYLAVQGANV